MTDSADTTEVRKDTCKKGDNKGRPYEYLVNMKTGERVKFLRWLSDTDADGKPYPSAKTNKQMMKDICDKQDEMLNLLRDIRQHQIEGGDDEDNYADDEEDDGSEEFLQSQRMDEVEIIPEKKKVKSVTATIEIKPKRKYTKRAREELPGLVEIKTAKKARSK